MNNTTKHIILILLCCLLVSFGRPTLCAAPSRRPAPCATSSTRPAPCATSASAPQYNFRSTSTFHTTGSYSSFRATQSYSSSRSGHNASAPTSRSSRSTYAPHSVSRYSVSRPSASHNSVPRYSAPIHRQSDQHLRSYGGGLTNPPAARSYSSAPTPSESASSVFIPSLPTPRPDKQPAQSQPTTSTTHNAQSYAIRYSLPALTISGLAVSQELTHPDIYSNDVTTSSISNPQKTVGIDGTGTPTHTWSYNGNTYGRDDDGTFYILFGGKWVKIAVSNPGDIGWQYSPVGTPWILFAFLLAYAAFIYFRKRKTPQDEI